LLPSGPEIIKEVVAVIHCQIRNYHFFTELVGFRDSPTTDLHFVSASLMEDYSGIANTEAQSERHEMYQGIVDLRYRLGFVLVDVKNSPKFIRSLSNGRGTAKTQISDLMKDFQRRVDRFKYPVVLAAPRGCIDSSSLARSTNPQDIKPAKWRSNEEVVELVNGLH
jgi:hypothetical protein